ncbi:MAG: hypothetical protein COA84_14135 [Robiginitomaculum sp.]|nr:MAG: hypothetical protein COA84_14135 [Robiginitomaculum sp.]
MEVHTDMFSDEVRDMVQERIDIHQDSIADVTYYHEAFEVVAGSDWNDYESEDNDFSNCDSSMQALMQEANGIVNTAWYSISGEVAEEITAEIMHFIEAAQGEDYNGKISLAACTTHGWTPHAKEDLEGVCFYYNLEGEKGLSALEYQVASGVYASICWNK